MPSFLNKAAIGVICVSILGPFLVAPCVVWLLVASVPTCVGMLLYAAWIWYDQSPSQPGKWAPLRRLGIWKHFADYFQLKLVDQTGGLEPSRTYLICGHPHGVCAFSHFGNFFTDATGIDKLFPGITVHASILHAHFLAPFHRELCLMLRARSCSRASLNNILSGPPGTAVFLLPGGAAEALYSSPGTCDIILRKRLGFVRVALETGAHLVPVLAFGETDTYVTTRPRPGSFGDKFQKFMLQRTGFGFPRFQGTGFVLHVGLLPKPVAITTVLGPPIQVPKYTGSTADPQFMELVARYHDQYCAALTQLWDANCSKYLPQQELGLHIME